MTGSVECRLWNVALIGNSYFAFSSFWVALRLLVLVLTFVLLAVIVVGFELTVNLESSNIRHLWFEARLSLQYLTVGRNTHALGSDGSRCLGSGSLNRLHLLDAEVWKRASTQEQVVWTHISDLIFKIWTWLQKICCIQLSLLLLYCFADFSANLIHIYYFFSIYENKACEAVAWCV